MTAFVRGVTAASMQAGSMFRSSRISTKTGVAPTRATTFAVAAKVIEVVITSSPGPTPAARRARWRPAVAELRATACLAPTYSQTSCSNRAHFGPVVIQPDRIEWRISAISSSPSEGRENASISLRRVIGVIGTFLPNGHYRASATGAQGRMPAKRRRDRRAESAEQNPLDKRLNIWSS